MLELEERVEIPKELLTKAVEYLSNHWDEGPCCEGWKSKDLINLIADLKTALGMDARKIWREH